MRGPICDIVERSPDQRLRLSDIGHIAAVCDVEGNDVFAVLSLLTAPEIEELSLEFRGFQGGKAAKMSVEHVTEMLTRWWREKTVSDSEWKEWSSRVEVSWVKGPRGKEAK